jgi:hypothetical protein
MKAERVDLHVPSADLRRWRATAAIDGVLLSEWIRRTCDASAMDQESFEVLKRNAEQKRVRVGRKSK